MSETDSERIARMRALGSKGGKAAHARGTAHKWTSEEARLQAMNGARAVMMKYGPNLHSEMGKKGAAKRKENKRLRELANNSLTTSDLSTDHAIDKSLDVEQSTANTVPSTNSSGESHNGKTEG